MKSKIELLHGLGVDMSMIILRTINNYLITEEMARTIAEMVIKDQYGGNELEEQKPLSIKGDEEHWYISGARQPTETVTGVEMTIAKADGQIMKFHGTQVFPPPPFSLEELARMSPEEVAKLSDM